MARRSSPYTQADITRLIKAAIAAGVGKEHIVGVRLDRDGATVLFGEKKPMQETERPNEWDEVLDDK
ncbi:hypothetical protein [Reyranella soli]|uniref:Uncharacterized protein n=1 Tax=Reyranella soli TaxID=1230389 RepID=A0A512N5A5_9HYPH|nr:hypothetical protein [Reyranella soli]GEP54169.1 hypothetical protein RSO01_13350 [Reyranella soli]